jgi:hypothetical protein
MARLVLHVTPHDDGKWEVEQEGGGVQSTFEDKDHAVAEATNQAKSAASGQIIVHGRDGKIQFERTYGQDPRNIPD